MIIREDLPRGSLAAQTGHAARESGYLAPPPKDSPPTHIVALAARCETHLLELEERLLAGGYPHISIREPDAPFCGAITAIGLPPQPKKSAPKFLSSLPTLKQESAYEER